MSNTPEQNKTTETTPSTTPSAANTQKIVDTHKAAGMHHEQASKHHFDAAKHMETGNPSKAAESTVKAHGHSALANDHQKDIVKEHAVGSKK
jgi:hypothetical protein